MLLALPDMESLMQVFALFRARLSLQAFEFFTDLALNHVLEHGAQRAIDGDYPYYVVAEFDAIDEKTQDIALATFEHAVEQGWVSDGVLAQSDAQAAALWRLREGITESLAPHRPYKNDVSVRVSAVPDFLQEMQALLAAEYPHIEVVWFGHIGDGNLHINVLRPADLDEAEFIAQCDHVTKLLAAPGPCWAHSATSQRSDSLLRAQVNTASCTRPDMYGMVRWVAKTATPCSRLELVLR
ncbi:MAG: hypothetical protein WDW36_004310 [Sanguina aurantia]